MSQYRLHQRIRQEQSMASNGMRVPKVRDIPDSVDDGEALPPPPQANEQSELIGTFHNESWRSSDGDFLIGQILDSTGKKIGIKGNASQDILRVGMEYKFLGQWKTHATYGRQFEFRAVITIEPTSRGAIIKYLQFCPGIGPKTAADLYEAFGGDSVRVLRENPTEACGRVERLKFDVAEKASQRLKSSAENETVRIELMSLFLKHRIPTAVIETLIKRKGRLAAQYVQANPFRLLEERGIGFDKADAIYNSLNLPNGRLCRQGYAAFYEAYDDRDGHTWFPASKLAAAVTKRVSGQEADPVRALEYCVRRKLLAVRTSCQMCSGSGLIQASAMEYCFGEFRADATGPMLPCLKCDGTGGQRMYAIRENAEHESRIARKIAELMNHLPRWPKVKAVPEGAEGLTNHQADALDKATSGAVGLFCGSPGTGKTYAIARIVQAIIDQHGGGSVCIAAPTGKAAVRSTECMREYKIDLAASTIHRLLGWELKPGGFMGHKYDKYNHLPFRFVIVDEASMIACPLMADLLEACGAGTHILFVGDINQLPPIDHGAPLRDFIRVKLPYGELTEIRRNSGSVVRACAAIRDGQPWETDAALDLDSDDPKNLIHLPAGKTQIASRIVDQVESIKLAGRFDPTWEVQVIVALNASGDASREKLNEVLQSILNPAGQQNEKWKFRVDDKVINTSNFSYPEYFDPTRNLGTPAGRGGDTTDQKYYVANGEIGRCIKFTDKNKAVIQFNEPRRVVVVSTIAEEAGNVELAYAVTGHRMQGSQEKIVIVALDPSSGAVHGVCSREWFFTCLSRMQVACYLVGEKSTAEMYCRRSVLPMRQTMLVEKITEERKKLIDEAEKARSGQLAKAESRPA